MGGGDGPATAAAQLGAVDVVVAPARCSWPTTLSARSTSRAHVSVLWTPALIETYVSPTSASTPSFHCEGTPRSPDSDSPPESDWKTSFAEPLVLLGVMPWVARTDASVSGLDRDGAAVPGLPDAVPLAEGQVDRVARLGLADGRAQRSRDLIGRRERAGVARPVDRIDLRLVAMGSAATATPGREDARGRQRHRDDPPQHGRRRRRSSPIRPFPSRGPSSRGATGPERTGRDRRATPPSCRVQPDMADD